MLIPLKWLLVCLMCLSGHVYAATMEISAHRIQLGTAFDYQSDPSRQMSVADVAAASDKFQPLAREQLNLGFNRDAHWLRINLRNASDTAVDRWLEIGHPRMHSVQMFWQKNGQWQMTETGRRLPMDMRPVAVGIPVLPLQLDAHETRTLYLRVQSATAVDFRAQVWSPKAFLENESSNLFGRGAFMAALLVSAMFAILIWLQLRDRIYMLFAGALVFQIGLEASWTGILELYLWPQHLAVNPSVNTTFSGMALFFHGLFIRAFLDLRNTLPIWGHVFTGLAITGLLSALGGYFHDFSFWVRIATFNALTMVALAPWPTLILVIRGYSPARLLLAGLVMLWLSVGVSQAMVVGIMPVWSLARESVPLATVITAMLILMAIANRTRKLGLALVKANAENRAKSTLLAHMSHELRTPLNTVIGFGRLLRQGLNHLSVQESGKAIERSGLHLLSMIDEMLDHARGELGQLTLTETPIPMNEFLQTVGESAAITAASKGNRFAIQAGKNLPAVVLLDVRRLRQVLDNLINNANLHTHQGTITLSCEVSERLSESRVGLCFRVIDTGEGVALEDRERIFLPFQQGQHKDPRQGSQGTGLGLSISRQLVAAMGGQLQLEKSSQQGSTFIFCIECSAPPQNCPDSMPELMGRRTNLGQGHKLLVVEDTDEIRELLASTLETVGYRVLSATGGHDALTKIANVDLVLMDQFMAHGDGWHLLKSIRASGSRIPVVLMSAADPCPPEDFPDDMHFDALVNKPLDLDQILRLLGKLLQGSVPPPPNIALDEATTSNPDDQLDMPPSGMRLELGRLVQAGSVSDIIAWCHDLSDEFPKWQSFADRVEKAAWRLDFVELTQLASAE